MGSLAGKDDRPRWVPDSGGGPRLGRDSCALISKEDQEASGERIQDSPRAFGRDLFVGLRPPGLSAASPAPAGTVGRVRRRLLLLRSAVSLRRVGGGLLLRVGLEPPGGCGGVAPLHARPLGLHRR